MARFLNPYNFVRPLPAPQNLSPLSEVTADLHLLWRCPPPPHDRYTGLSGRITCKMTAKTPVFVSDSEIVSEQNGHKTYRFFNVNGDDMIPASSLRGPIRSVFEAATNSTFGAFTFKDDPLFYRQPPEVALGLVPARVEQDENSESGCKLRLLTGSQNLELGSKNLYAAWIPSYRNEQILNKPQFDRRGNDRYKHILNNNDIVKIAKDCSDGSLCYAAVIHTRRKGFPHHQADFIAKKREDVQKWVNSQQNRNYSVASGYVYVTGLNADLKQYERFFYYGQQEHFAQLTKGNIDAYNHLMSDYHKRKDSIANSLSNAERNGIKPSRFVKQLEQLKEGTLVYADLEGTNRDPKVRAIYPIAISRTMYERTIRDVIAAHHPHLLPPTDINKLCLASRVFGWVSQEADKQDLTQEVAYRGRVRFSNATIVHPNKNDDPLTLSILGSPHPTSLEFYLDGVKNIKAQRDGQHGYNEPSAKIRGRKIYRHHKRWDRAEATTNDRSDQNRTIQGVYEPYSQWKFTIEFENLQPVELGALLWTLELNEDGKQGHHRIGYGKPLGFGSVQIEVTGLDFYDAKTRYTPEQTELTDGKQHQSTLIKRFREGMQSLYGNTPFDTLDNIVGLLDLLSERSDDLPIHYPRLDRNRQAADNEGFRWFMTNRDGQLERLKPARSDDGLPYNVSANNRRNRR